MTAAAEATAVIAAAGSGERLGEGTPKALVALAGRPLVAWCLDACAEATAIDAVVVAAPPGHSEHIVELAPPGLRLAAVEGGDSRAESVARALAGVTSEIVVVHDAARPLVTAELLDAVVGELAAHPDAAGMIAAAPIHETVKRVDSRSRIVQGTEDREHLWAAQTPQAFRAQTLRAAIAAAGSGLSAATDEATLVEAAAGKVLVRRSSPRNLKVTTADDLRLAELLLAGLD